MSVLDNFQPKSGDFPPAFKPDQGQYIDGIIADIRAHTFTGDAEPTIIMDWAEGSDCSAGIGEKNGSWSMICGSTGLHNAILRERPEIGKRCRVERGRNAGKAYTWVVTVGGDAPAPAAPSAAPAPAPVPDGDKPF